MLKIRFHPRDREAAAGKGRDAGKGEPEVLRRYLVGYVPHQEVDGQLGGFNGDPFTRAAVPPVVIAALCGMKL